MLRLLHNEETIMRKRFLSPEFVFAPLILGTLMAGNGCGKQEDKGISKGEWEATRKPSREASEAGDEQRAVAAIERLGGKLTRGRDLPGKPVVVASLKGTGATDDDMRELKGFPHLQLLDLTGTKVGDAGLARLKGLTGLRSLILDFTPVTQDSIASLKNLPLLNTGMLDGTGGTDAGLSPL